MDGFTEKKWFIYLGDHHEGPFSLEDVQSRMQQGQFTSTNYVWAEGMGDWQMMSQVQAFESILMPAAPPPMAAMTAPELAPTLTAAGPASSVSGFSAISIEQQSSGPVLSAATPAMTATFGEPFDEPTAASLELHPQDLPADLDGPAAKKALMRSMLKVGALLLVLGGVGIAYTEGYLKPLLNSQTLRGATQSFSNVSEPVLSALGFSPIPKLDDVEPEEYEQLKAAARAKLDEAGPQIAIALSHGDLITPTFYVASNLPDGAILDLYIEGISDSLLNQLTLNAKTQVTLTHRFGKAAALQLPANVHALARGQYNLYVVDPETQPAPVRAQMARATAVSMTALPLSIPKGLKVVATHSYFLGGLKDATYTARLQEFHQKLTAKAQTELTELKQIAATLDAKLAETSQKFSALKKGRKVSAGQKKNWDAYHEQWTGLFQQLGQTFSKLTPETIQNDYFYGYLYQMCQQTSDSLNQLHKLQNTYFAGPLPDAKSYEIQLGEVSAIAKGAIDALKAKIDQVAALPPTPNGLPKRDSL